MDAYRYHNGTRWVGGTAALHHKVKEDGGLNAHNQQVIYKALPNIVSALIEDENKKTARNSIRRVI